MARIDPRSPGSPTLTPVRSGSISASQQSDASSGAGNLINLVVTGGTWASPAVLQAPSNPTDHQKITWHLVAQGADRVVTFSGFQTAGVIAGPVLIPRGQVLIVDAEYVGVLATSADAANPLWALRDIHPTWMTVEPEVKAYVDPAVVRPYPLSRWGLLAANMHLMEGLIGTSFGGTTYQLFLRTVIPAGVAVSGIATILSTAMAVSSGSLAAGSGQNGFAFYELSGTTGTRAQQTATDLTLWTSTGWAKKALPAVVAAQQADREVIVGVGWSGSGTGLTGPTIRGMGTGSSLPLNTRVDTGANLYHVLSTTANTSWPASLDLTSLTRDNTIPFLGFY